MKNLLGEEITETDVSHIKGLIDTGLYHQEAIAEYYHINHGRISEIKTGKKSGRPYRHVKAAPKNKLPVGVIKKIPRSVNGAGNTLNGKYRRPQREMAISDLSDDLCLALQRFEESLYHVEKKYSNLTREEKQSIINTLQQVSLKYQLISQGIEL